MRVTCTKRIKANTDSPFKYDHTIDLSIFKIYILKISIALYGRYIGAIVYCANIALC